MRKSIAPALATLVAAINPVAAEGLSDDPKIAAKIRAAELWLETTLSHEAVPAGSFAIVHDQEVIWSKGFGVASLETQTPATADTRFSVCSISKLFTSIGAMQLRDVNRLDLDRPVKAYLNWFDIKDIENAEQPVTIRNILSHVSGLPREADLPYWGEVDFPTSAEIHDRVKDQSKLYRPYDYFQYSNLGMTVVGETIARLSRRSYDEYITTYILGPLGMNATTTDLPVDLHGGDFAAGYLVRNGNGERQQVPSYTINGIAPAAGFASSVNDLAKFASWQFRLRENGGEEVLKATTLREMQRVHWIEPDFDGPAWGLGFATRRHNGKTFWGHGGYCPGYRAEFFIRPEEKLAYIAMVNVNDVSPGALAFDLYDLTSDDITAAVKKKEAEEKEGADKPAPEQDEKENPDFSLYEGVYANPGYDWDTFYGFDGEQLFSIDLYTNDPAGSLTKFEHIEGHVFKRKRDDDTLAEEIRFEVGDDGKVVRVWQHSNYLMRQ